VRLREQEMKNTLRLDICLIMRRAEGNPICRKDCSFVLELLESAVRLQVRGHSAASWLGPAPLISQGSLRGEPAGSHLKPCVSLTQRKPYGSSIFIEEASIESIEINSKSAI
jgi:hypothetical protein